jgi:hypothetical protein
MCAANDLSGKIHRLNQSWLYGSDGPHGRIPARNLALRDCQPMIAAVYARKGIEWRA